MTAFPKPLVFLESLQSRVEFDIKLRKFLWAFQEMMLLVTKVAGMENDGALSTK